MCGHAIYECDDDDDVEMMVMMRGLAQQAMVLSVQESCCPCLYKAVGKGRGGKDPPLPSPVTCSRSSRRDKEGPTPRACMGVSVHTCTRAHAMFARVCKLTYTHTQGAHAHTTPCIPGGDAGEGHVEQVIVFDQALHDLVHVGEREAALRVPRAQLPVVVVQGLQVLVHIQGPANQAQVERACADV